eukprot:scaffold387_cov195-Alexandrium_tamarense.AAC.6
MNVPKRFDTTVATRIFPKNNEPNITRCHFLPGVEALPPKRLPAGAGVLLPNKDVGAAAGASQTKWKRVIIYKMRIKISHQFSKYLPHSRCYSPPKRPVEAGASCIEQLS